jgi:hypothetical protein
MPTSRYCRDSFSRIHLNITSIAVFLTFNKCLDMRTDIDSPTRFTILRAALVHVKTFGQAWADSDEITASGTLVAKEISQLDSTSLLHTIVSLSWVQLTSKVGDCRLQLDSACRKRTHGTLTVLQPPFLQLVSLLPSRKLEAMKFSGRRRSLYIVDL